MLNKSATKGLDGNKDWKSRLSQKNGCWVIVASVLWGHMAVEGVIPEWTSKVHLLWCLHLMKVYSKRNVLAFTVRCDPKMFRKWAWRLAEAISGIQYKIVSGFCNFICFIQFGIRFHTYLILFITVVHGLLLFYEICPNLSNISFFRLSEAIVTGWTRVTIA